MLVLTRKAGEELVIGDNIRVVVNRVAGNRVTLGLVAPQDVRIVRGELRETVESFEESDPPPPIEFPLEVELSIPRQAR